MLLTAVRYVPFGLKRAERIEIIRLAEQYAIRQIDRTQEEGGVRCYA